MQNEFPLFRKIEVELTQEKEIEKIPDRPSKYPNVVSVLPPKSKMLNAHNNRKVNISKGKWVEMKTLHWILFSQTWCFTIYCRSPSSSNW